MRTSLILLLLSSVCAEGQIDGLGNQSVRQKGVVYAEDFGVLHNTKYVVDATTNSTTTVTCPNSDCNFVNASAPSGDVGKVVWGIYGNIQGGGGMLSGVLVVPQGTISSVNSATSITVSVSATASHSSSVVLIWGSDDTQALSDAFAASYASPYGSCLPIKLPSGLMITQKGQFNNAPAQCLATTGMNRAGVNVIGDSIAVSQLVITPSFVWSTCNGPSGGCFGDNHSSTYAFSGGTYFHGWAVTGMGYTSLGPTSGTTYLVVLNDNSILEDWYCTGIGASNTDLVGVYSSNAIPSQLFNVQIDGCGYNAAILGGLVSIGGNSYFGDVAGTALSVTGGTVQSTANAIGPAQAGQAALSITGGTFLSENDNICMGDAGAGGSLVTISAGSVWLLNDCLSTAKTGSSSAVINSTGGTVHLQQTNLTNTGGTGVYGVYDNGGTFFDDGGNSISAASGSVFTIASGNLFRSQSINQNALATGNLTLGAGWGSTASKSAINGDSHDGTFEITSSGTGQAANPTLAFTFPTTYWIAPAYCQIWQGGGTNFTDVTNPVWSSLSKSGITWTWSGTPVSAHTYILMYHCGP
jgi:hypothetical protein